MFVSRIIWSVLALIFAFYNFIEGYYHDNIILLINALLLSIGSFLMLW